MLGLQSNGHVLTRVACLPLAERAQAPSDLNAGSGGPIDVKRWLLRHEGYRFGA